MIRKISLYCICLLLLTAGCQPNNKQSKEEDAESKNILSAKLLEYYQRIFLPEVPGIFRAIRMDLSLREVREIEGQYDLVLADESDNFLQYETDLSVDTVHGSDYAEIKYIFDDSDRLDIVTINYYIQDSTTINELFDHLNLTFSDKFGDYYIDSDGYTVWESSYMRNDSTEVAFDIGIRKFIKLNDPGLTVELMRFGSL